MEITSKSQGSFYIKGKRATLLVSPDTLLFEDRKDVKIAGPGEYEVSGVVILGRRLDGEVSFRMVIDGVRLLYLASAPKTIDELEQFIPVDVLLLGVYSRDIHELDSKIIVPFTDEVGRLLGKEVERSKKLTVFADKLPEDMKVVVLYG